MYELLIWHILLQAVKDADMLSRGGFHIRSCAESRERDKQHLRRWLDSNRFEFWTAVINLDTETAERGIIEISEGQRNINIRAGTATAVAGDRSRSGARHRVSDVRGCG